MKDISVEELAKIVGTPEDKILSQMKEAGLNQTLASDLVTDQDKKILLDFLKGCSQTDDYSYKEKEG